jgi:hypothetical protein
VVEKIPLKTFGERKETAERKYTLKKIALQQIQCSK